MKSQFGITKKITKIGYPNLGYPIVETEKTKMLAPIITNNLNEIKALSVMHKVKELFVFGSAAKNEMTEKSDIDFVVDFENVDPYYFADNYFSFLEKLENLLKRKVDFVTEKYLQNKYFIEELKNTKIKLI